MAFKPPTVREGSKRRSSSPGTGSETGSFTSAMFSGEVSCVTSFDPSEEISEIPESADEEASEDTPAAAAFWEEAVCSAAGTSR